jgi:hypothetical protein
VYNASLPAEPLDAQGDPPALIVTAFRLNRCGTAGYIYRLQTVASFSSPHLPLWRPRRRAIALFEGTYDRGSLEINERYVWWRTHGHRRQEPIPSGWCAY